MSPKKLRCTAQTKNGKPCGAAPTPTGLCFFHGNPNKASELGRIGGKRNRRPKEEHARPVLKLNGAASASDRLDSLYHKALSEKLLTAQIGVTTRMVPAGSGATRTKVTPNRLRSASMATQAAT